MASTSLSWQAIGPTDARAGCPVSIAMLSPKAMSQEDKLSAGSPPDFDSGPELVRDALSRKALASARHRAAVGRVLGLGETEMEAVVHLARAGQLTPSRLAAQIGLSSGGMTAMVQRLEGSGHLVRRPHPVDGRSVLLRLSPTLRERAEALFAPLIHDLDRMIVRLPKPEREALARLLHQAAEVNERHADALLAEVTEAADADAAPLVPGLWA